MKNVFGRDASRPNPIGAKVIKDTWRRYRNFIIHEDIMAMKAKASQQNPDLPVAIICDMDATLCLNTSGRPFYGEGAAEGMEKDEPINEIVDLVRAYCNFHNVELIILTGREDTRNLARLLRNGLMRIYYVQTWFLCDLKEITQQDQTVRKSYTRNM